LSQTRLHFIARKPTSQALFAALDAEFEDDGFALALIEVDEDEGTEEFSLYCDPEFVEDAEQRIKRILASQAQDIEIEHERLDDVDWVIKSLEGLKPVRAGKILVHGSHDRDQLQPGDISIEIEAGLAFGTGHHGTTAGCLEMLTSVIESEKPRNALDLGTGSAVLAIALAKLAQIPVLATDIDPIATDVAAENVQLNGVSDYVTTATAEGFDAPIFAEHAPFQLIVANILAGPLMELAPHMATHLAPAGTLVLSGILDRQHDAVRDAYTAEGFNYIETLTRGEWVTIRFTR
jgi:ribosomal protein L11 methyltransferase